MWYFNENITIGGGAAFSCWDTNQYWFVGIHSLLRALFAFSCRTNGQKTIKWISDFASIHWNAPKLEYWLLLRTSCPINHIYVDGSFAIVCSSQPLPHTYTHCEWDGVKYMYNAHTTQSIKSADALLCTVLSIFLYMFVDMCVCECECVVYTDLPFWHWYL